MSKTEKVCQICGKPFSGRGESHYCSDCAAKIKSNVIADRTCIDCGTTFKGGPRARRCPICREIARRAKKKKPTARPLGSIDICQRCGNEYVVEGGRQKYCTACQKDALLEWQREHKVGYNKKPEIESKKQEKRKNQLKMCLYCQKSFRSETPSAYCSEYCKKEQAKLNQCIADIKRGKKRDLKKYKDAREEYRKKSKERG